MKRKLVTVDAETLLSTPMSKTMFIVNGLIPQEVNALSIVSKISKNWLNQRPAFRFDGRFHP